MEQIKKIWPKWEVLEILGQGGFGTVYKAKRDNFGDVAYAAIKVVKIPNNINEVKEMTGSGLSKEDIKNYYQKSILNLVDEIKMMSKFKTASHIVSIEDFDVVENSNGIGGTIYIRMELLKNIGDYFDTGNINRNEVVRMGIDILTALEFCHNQNVIHRDIKPDNIFISEFNEFKLGDFGISREVEKTNATMSQKGTKSYMAPEMIRMGKYGKNVDLYALGLTMYELLNHGRMPFLPKAPQPFYPQDREEAMIKRLMGEEFPDLDGYEDINNIIKKACHPNPEERYQNATEMKNDLLALDKDNHEEIENNDFLENDSFLFVEETQSDKDLFGDKSTMGMFSDLPFEKEEKQEENSISKEKVFEYVVDRINKENNIHLKNDILAYQRVQYMVDHDYKNFLKTGKMYLDLSYLTCNNDGVVHVNMTIDKSMFETKSSHVNNDGWIFKDESINYDNNKNKDHQSKTVEHVILCPHCGQKAVLMFTDGYYCTSCTKVIHKGSDKEKHQKLTRLFLDLFIGENKDNYHKQISILDQMLEIDPNSAQLYFRKGQTYGSLNNGDAQLQCYLKAVELDDKDAMIHNGLCVCYITRQNFNKAYEHGKRAYEQMCKGMLTRTDSEDKIYANYAIALEKTNRSQEAHRMLMGAVRYRYHNANALALNWDVGSQYYESIVREALNTNKFNSSKNILIDPLDTGFDSQDNISRVLGFKKNYKTILALKGEKWFGRAYTLAFTDHAIHFYTNQCWQMPYYDFVNFKISYANKKITLTSKVNQQTYTFDTGKDTFIIYNLLLAIQRKL